MKQEAAWARDAGVVAALLMLAAWTGGAAAAGIPAGARLVVVTPGIVAEPSVGATLDAANLLPLGGVYAAERDAASARDVVQALRPEGFVLEKQLQADLFVALLRAGHGASTAVVARRPGGDVPPPFLRIDQLPEAAEAHSILDARIRRWGFAAPTSFADLRAVLDVEVRVVDARTQRPRIVRRYVYAPGGFRFAADAAEVPPSTPPATFAGRAVLARDAPGMVAALRAASRDVAAAIVAGL